MRAVVKKDFRDKYTNALYKAGSELELTPERYAEIRATDAALIVAVAEEPEQTAGQQDTAETEPDEQAAEAAGQTKPKRTKKQTKQDE